MLNRQTLCDRMREKHGPAEDRFLRFYHSRTRRLADGEDYITYWRQRGELLRGHLIMMVPSPTHPPTLSLTFGGGSTEALLADKIRLFCKGRHYWRLK